MLKAFRNEENWKEDFTVKFKGKDVPVNVDARIVLPEQKSFPVAEGEIVDMDASFKEKAVRSLFGDTDIYLRNEENMARDELEQVIERETSLLDIYKAQGADIYKWHKEYLGKCKEYLTNAKDTYTVTAGDFEESRYAAKRDGIWYTLDFHKPGEEDFRYEKTNPQQLRFQVKNPLETAPESLRECDAVETERVRPDAKETENPCKYSLEEARKMAEDFLKDTGLSDMAVIKEYALYWEGLNYENGDKDSGQIAGNENNGYYFELGLKKDGNIIFEDRYHSRFGGNISVSDAGIVEVNLFYPFSIEKISDSVKLLPLDEIKEGFRQEINSHMEEHPWAPEESLDKIPALFKSLKFIIAPVRNEKQPNKVSFLPCWLLSCEEDDGDPDDGTQDGGSLGDIYLNAIDGSVIMDENICDGANT